MMNRLAIACLAVGFILAASATCTWGDITVDLPGLETVIPPKASDSFDVGPLAPEGARIRLQGTLTMGRAHHRIFPWETMDLVGTIVVKMTEPEDGYWEAQEGMSSSGAFSVDKEFNWFGQGESSWSFLEDGASTVEVELSFFIPLIFEIDSLPAINVSHAQLTIETAPTRLTVTSPDGGETWQAGTTHNITWTSSASVGANVRIELYKGGVRNSTISSSTSNDGSYNWSIPLSQTTGSDYRVKITSTSIPTSFDESDDYFSIIGDDYFPIIGDVVIFEDSFPSPAINRDKWPFIYGAEVDDKGTKEPSPEYSLHLNGHSSGGDLIESRVIDLSSYSGATLTYYYQRTGLYGNAPEEGEDLIIEYDDGSGWVELDRQSAIGPVMTDYDPSGNIPLPLDALHSGFKLRLQRGAGTFGSYDDWFVDDVKILIDAKQVVPAGSLVAWGANERGQCDVPAGNDYVAMAGGLFHTLALKSDGSIVAWGENHHGQATPPEGKDFVAVAAGGNHNLALKSDGSIVAWGYDNWGQATPPAGTDYVDIASGLYHNLALKSDGSIVGWGENISGQATPPAGNDYVAIAAGGYHSLALKSDGLLVGWGENGMFGQATPPTGNDFVAITAGWHHSLALKSDGSIVGWGSSLNGQATPPAGNDFVAIAPGGRHSLALKSDGSIVGWGGNISGQATPPAGNDYVAIAAGGYHGLALKSDGLIVGW